MAIRNLVHCHHFSPTISMWCLLLETTILPRRPWTWGHGSWMNSVWQANRYVRETFINAGSACLVSSLQSREWNESIFPQLLAFINFRCTDGPTHYEQPFHFRTMGSFPQNGGSFKMCVWSHDFGYFITQLFYLLLYCIGVPWVMQNRGDLDIFVHPNTGMEVSDHLRWSIWYNCLLLAT